MMRGLIFGGLVILLTAAPAQAGRGFWHSTTDPFPGLPPTQIRSVIIDPVVPTTLYVLGERPPCVLYPIPGLPCPFPGLPSVPFPSVKSDDGGLTWRDLGLNH